MAKSSQPLALRPFGDYILLGEIARGGMGVVYSAREVKTNRRVALKMIQSGALASPAALQRFRTEAEAMHQLEHPNIVPIYRVDGYQGQEYLVMKLIEGGSLASAMSEGELGFLPPSQPRDSTHEQTRIVELVAKVARAVQHAHARGVLHRDLKPSNILLDEVGEPFLTDFGIAKFLESDGGQTQTQGLLGTLHYMSPEQASGRSKEMTTAADIYSLGAILYELLTGRPPFTGEDTLHFLQQLNDTPPTRPRVLNPAVDGDLELICLKCLEKEPRSRYLTAEALAVDLERWLKGEAVTLRPLGAVERLRRYCRRRPLVTSLVAALILLSLVGILGTVVAFRRINLAMRHAEVEQGRATRFANESRTRLATLCVEHGNQLLEDGERIRALPWLVEGLALTGSNAASASVQRVRVGFALEGYPRLHQLIFQDEGMAGMDLSSDGRWLISASRLGTVTVWDTLANQPFGSPWLHKLAVEELQFDRNHEHVVMSLGDRDCSGLVEIWKFGPNPRLEKTLQRSAFVRRLLFTADSQRLILGCSDGSLSCVSFPQGETLWERREHTDSIESLSVSTDGKWLATGSWDESVRVWDLNTGVPHQDPLRVGGYVRSARFSPRENSILIGCDDGIARWWNPFDAESKPQEWVHGDRIYHVSISPDGLIGATCGRDGVVKLWKLDTGQLSAPPLVHHGLVREAVFTPDGAALLTASSDKTSRLWDVKTGAPLCSSLLHSAAVQQPLVAADGKSFYTGADDGMIRRWEMPSGGPQGVWESRFPEQVQSAALSADGQRVLVGCSDGSVFLVHAGTGATISSLRGHTNLVESCRFSPDGRLAATASFDGTARLWDLDSQRATLVVGHAHPFAANTATALDFSPDGRLLATAEDRASLRVWDTLTKLPVCEPLPQSNYILHVVFSATNSLVGIGCGTRQRRDPGQLVIFRATPTGVIQQRVFSHPCPVWRVAFSPDGKTVATGGGDGRLRLWRLETGELIYDQMQHGAEVLRVGFSVDGRLLFSCGGDHMARIWDAGTGESICPPIAAEGRVVAQLDPTGRLLATASRDGIARVWDVASGQAVSQPFRHSGWVNLALFTPSGDRLLTTSTDGLVSMRRVPALRASVDELRFISIVLTGTEVSEHGQTSVASNARVHEAWAKLSQIRSREPRLDR